MCTFRFPWHKGWIKKKNLMPYGWSTENIYVKCSGLKEPRRLRRTEMLHFAFRTWKAKYDELMPHPAYKHKKTTTPAKPKPKLCVANQRTIIISRIGKHSCFLLTCKRWEPSSVVMLSRELNLVWPHASPRPTDKNKERQIIKQLQSSWQT